MDRLKRRWKRVPAAIRKPVVLAIGLLFVIAAGLTGWLPGPGGIPLFLVGIAILSTEFAWAKRIRDRVVDIVERGGRMFKRHPVIGTILILLFAAVIIVAGIKLWKYIY